MIRIGASFTLEFVIVNDGSKDGSGDIVPHFPFRNQIQFVDLSVNSGKGAIAAGLAYATGSIVGIQDADFEYRFEDIIRLVEPIIEDRATLSTALASTRTLRCASTSNVSLSG